MIYGKNHEVDYYMGHWKTGRKNGIGLQILKDGTVQQGTFKNGKFEAAWNLILLQ